VNCRVNEEKVFPSPRTSTLLQQKFVEARLHTDGEKNLDEILALQDELAKTVANPTYVIQDPVTKRILGAPLSGVVTVNGFAEYLEAALDAKEQVGRLPGR